MSLMDNLGDERPWEVVGTDISRDVLAKARQGVYRTERIDGVPPEPAPPFPAWHRQPGGHAAGGAGGARQRVQFSGPT